jgi:nucleoside-diphosphate-sugar epimerase
VPYDADEAYGERAAGFEDMRRRVPDASKLFAYTGFRPSIGLDQTLREVIDYELSLGASTEPASEPGINSPLSRGSGALGG